MVAVGFMVLGRTPEKLIELHFLGSFMEDENFMSYSDMIAIIDIINHQTSKDHGIMVL